MKNLKGKVALITGASRGIGVTICTKLAQQGMQLIGVARNKEGLEQTAALIRREGGIFHCLPFDLSRPQHLSSMVDEVHKLNLFPEIIINNAGIERYSFFQDQSYEELEATLHTNLLAPMEITRLFLPDLLKKKGHIINIASLAGKKGVIYNSPYSASKAGLIMWSDSMRQELKGSSVDVTVICPGYISEAGMFHDSNVKAPALLGTSLPIDVANAVLEAIVKRPAEIIVNKGPIRPLLALGQLSPSLADKIVGLMGIRELNFKRIKN